MATNAQYLASLVNSSGNINIPVSNAGVVFNNSSATTNSTLNDYETGTWTPTDVSGAGLTLTVNSAAYTKIGRLVNILFYVSYPVTANTATPIISLPFSPSTAQANGLYAELTTRVLTAIIGTVVAQVNPANNAILLVYNNSSSNPTNATMTGAGVLVQGSYLAQF